MASSTSPSGGGDDKPLRFSTRVNQAIDDIVNNGSSSSSNSNDNTYASAAASAKTTGTVSGDRTFDRPDFNDIEFINQLFPTKQSLEQLDPFIVKLRRKVHQLDEEILTSVRRQATAGPQARRDLDETKSAIQSLFVKLRDIKNKAEQSEQMVQEITKNIKSLDYGKRNLTTTIRALKRLHMLVAAVDQLKRMARKRHYRQTAHSLEAINTLAKDFERFSDIPKIRDLFDNIERIKNTLREQILSEFKTAWDSHEERHMAPQELLADAAAVADAMGDKMRQQLITHHVRNVISLYKMIFGSERNKEAALEHVQKRYNWLKKKLKQHEEQYGEVFPRHWCVPQEITVEFCLVTRSDIERMLKDNHNAQVLHTALLKTISFERDMHNRFHTLTEKDLERDLTDSMNAVDQEILDVSPDDMKGMMKSSEGIKRHFQLIVKKRELERQQRQKERDSLVASGPRPIVPKDVAKKNYNFLGFISTCFEGSMDTYVTFEDNTMREKLRIIMSRETWNPADSNNSSQDLFIYISESMKNCTAFNRGTVLFKLLQHWKKYLREYADELLSKVPKMKMSSDSSKESFMRLDFSSLISHASGGDTVSKLDDRNTEIVCYIINTADYCQDNCEAMEAEVRRQLEEPFTNQVDLSNEQGKFYKVLKTCIETLVISVVNTVEPEFVKMSKTNWTAFEMVGDQSPYISAITALLSDLLPNIANRIPRNHFKFFCDNLVITFVHVYISFLYKCKRLSSSGAQQLLLDVSSLATFLKGLINVGDPTRFDEDELNSFSKKVVLRTQRAEAILKVVLASPETMVETYQSLVKDGSQQELQKIFDMKGIAAKDRTTLLNRLEGLRSTTNNLVNRVQNFI